MSDEERGFSKGALALIIIAIIVAFIPLTIWFAITWPFYLGRYIHQKYILLLCCAFFRS